MAGHQESFTSKLDTRALPASEQVRLAKLAQAGDLAARDVLVQRSLGLVRMVARRYMLQCRTLDFDDLVLEGAMGVVRAIETFDPERAAFSTYAIWWIRARVVRYVNGDTHAMHVPNGAVELGRQVRVRRREIVKSRIDAGEVEALLLREFGAEAMAVAARIANATVSMDADVGEDDDSNLHNVVASGTNVEDDVLAQDAERKIQAVADTVRSSLSPVCRAILDRRLLGDETLQDVALTFDLSRERIRQLEVVVLQKLRKAFVKKLPEEVAGRSKDVRPPVQFTPREFVVRREKRGQPVVLPPPAVKSRSVAANGLRVGDVVGAASAPSPPPQPPLRNALVALAPLTPAAPEPIEEPMVEAKTPDAKLTPRQVQIIELANGGKRPLVIAEVMGISRASVDTTIRELRNRGFITTPPTRGPNRPTGAAGLTKKQAEVCAEWNAGTRIEGIALNVGQSIGAVRHTLNALADRNVLTRPLPPKVGEERVENGERRAQLLEVLEDGVTRTTAEISRATGATKETARVILRDLAKHGQVERPGVGQWRRAGGALVVGETSETEEPVKVKKDRDLTDQQQAIADAWDRGLTLKKIAKTLNVPPGTVGSTVGKLKKLGLVRRVGRTEVEIEAPDSSDDPVVADLLTKRAGLQAKIDAIDSLVRVRVQRRKLEDEERDLLAKVEAR
jgi:RNA polymerase sigma factor (sigma-70 family)